MKNGKGKIIYNNGNEYEGEWKNDKKNGEGYIEYINEQDKFKGEFENDMEKNGEGLIIKEDYKYIGTIQNYHKRIKKVKYIIKMVINIMVILKMI